MNRLNEQTSVDPKAHGWTQTGTGQRRSWAKEQDGSRPTTASPDRYSHPGHAGHELHVYPSNWRHEKPNGGTTTIRGRTYRAGADTVAQGSDKASLAQHLSKFSSQGSKGLTENSHVRMFLSSDGYRFYQWADGKWRDAPEGSGRDYDLEFDDHNGHPIDDMGELLTGHVA